MSLYAHNINTDEITFCVVDSGYSFFLTINVMSLVIQPTAFKVKGHDNPFVNVHGDTSHAWDDHEGIVKALDAPVVVRVDAPLQDIVFAANAGVRLVGLPKVVLLSKMKYKHRRLETPYFRKIFKELGYTTFDFPTHVFEGQAEMKYFYKGSLVIHGYGFRSTRGTPLKQVMQRIYAKYRVACPEVISVELVDPYMYHLDIAMLGFSDTACIVHKRAFSESTLRYLKTLLTVHVIDVDDMFCLNAVVQGTRLLVHKVTPPIQRLLAKITNLTVVSLNASSFENAGGSIRCTVMDI